MAVKQHDHKPEHPAAGKGGAHHGGTTHGGEHGHDHHGNKTKKKTNVHAPHHGRRAASKAIHSAHPKANHSHEKGGDKARHQKKDHHLHSS
jgi:hypothetical protein